jgi:hypothetical protein
MLMHRYFSTACYHDEHGYCQARQATDYLGQDFNRRPAQCKFCGAPCICPCHGLHIQSDGIDTPRSPTD